MILSNFSFLFFINSLLFGVALAVDAFTVSIANGMNEPNIKKGKSFLIASMFAFFQALMPMIGWVCVHKIVEKFEVFATYVPWIALILLTFLGVKMIISSFKNKGKDKKVAIGFVALLLQAIATSIDALSVGFTISSFNIYQAIVCCLIIALVTFILCFIGVGIGKKFGTIFTSKAELIGGIILIVIGIEIILHSVIGKIIM